MTFVVPRSQQPETLGLYQIFGTKRPTFWESLTAESKTKSVNTDICRAFSKETAWDIAGPVLEHWNNVLVHAVHATFSNHRASIVRGRGWDGAIDCWMIGDQADSAVPKIVLSCLDLPTVKRFMKKLTKDKCLRSSGFDLVGRRGCLEYVADNNFGQGPYREPLYYHEASRDIAGRNLHLVSVPSFVGSGMNDKDSAWAQLSDRSVPSFVDVCGQHVDILALDHGRETNIRASTIGGVIVVGKEFYYLTAAHPFLAMTAPLSPGAFRKPEARGGPIGAVVNPLLGGVMKSGKGFGDILGVGFGNAGVEHEKKSRPPLRPENSSYAFQSQVLTPQHQLSLPVVENMSVSTKLPSSLQGRQGDLTSTQDNDQDSKLNQKATAMASPYLKHSGRIISVEPESKPRLDTIADQKDDSAYLSFSWDEFDDEQEVSDDNLDDETEQTQIQPSPNESLHFKKSSVRLVDRADIFKSFNTNIPRLRQQRIAAFHGVDAHQPHDAGLGKDWALLRPIIGAKHIINQVQFRGRTVNITRVGDVSQLTNAILVRSKHGEPRPVNCSRAISLITAPGGTLLTLAHKVYEELGALHFSSPLPH